ncbi:MAG: ornithine carbamoyltransferase [Verrucomicrobia bacterium]|nr:MAG: ornithine carbamoyltransferase [Verrucomicrobiota bacterium]
MKHFLRETDFNADEAAAVLELARDFKGGGNRSSGAALSGQSWGLIFSKSSTRTRVSFEVGIYELGGNALFLSRNDIQLGRGETVADTARVLSRYLHGLVVRTFDQSDVEELAEYGEIPVINALTDFLHPCQLYTDVFTAAERWAGAGDLAESLKGRKVAFFGDCANNVANSWLLGAGLFDMEIILSGPEEFAPGPEIQGLLKEKGFGGRYSFTTDPIEAARDADILYTDVWVSMGMEEEARERIEQMIPYAVTSELFGVARDDALFMHCLPAYAGKEVTQEVLDSDRSIIFDQAENRLHTQKAILATLAEARRS